MNYFSKTQSSWAIEKPRLNIMLTKLTVSTANSKLRMFIMEIIDLYYSFNTKSVTWKTPSF